MGMNKRRSPGCEQKSAFETQAFPIANYAETKKSFDVISGLVVRVAN
jgi:hypothetical protein